jgi:hypothetical protein
MNTEQAGHRMFGTAQAQIELGGFRVQRNRSGPGIMNPRRDSEGGVGRLPTPSSPANCIDPLKISNHKLTHKKLILATPYSDWQPPLRI